MNLFRHMTNNVRPVKVPADMKGLKIRVPETPTIKMAIEAAGGNPVPMVWGEVYTGLQQKTIDGQENPLAILWASKIYEVQKYLSLTGHAYSPTNILIGDKLYQSMPADLQKIINDAAKNAGAWNRDFAEKQETELLGMLKEKGMQFYFLPPYSPELKRIEILWKKMKYEWLQERMKSPICAGGLRESNDVWI